MPPPGKNASKARRVVLLIDEDPRIGRLVRLSLHGPNCEVLASSKYAEGLKMAARLRPNLIIMETRFAKTDGLELARSLRESPETRGCGLIFLTESRSIVTRFQSIHLGANDYLHKPVEGKKLSVRVEAVFSALEQGNPGGGPVTGPAAERLIDILGHVEQESSTCTLELSRAGQTAHVSFNHGALQQAACGSLRGGEALNAVAREGDWAIDVTDKERPGPSPSQVITQPGEIDDLTSTNPNLPTLGEDLSAVAGSPSDPLLDDPTPPDGVVAPGPGGELDITLPARSVKPPPRRAPREQLLNLQPQESLGGEEYIADADDQTIVNTGANPLFRELATEPGSPADAVRMVHTTPAVEPRVTPVMAPAVKQVGAMLDARSTDEFQGASKLEFPAEEPETNPQSVKLFTPPPASAAPAAAPRAAGVPTQPLASASPPPEVEEFDPAEVHRWAGTFPQNPVLLVITNNEVRLTLQEAAQDRKMTVAFAASGHEAYRVAVQTLPLAIICDARLPDMNGRDLLGGVRVDFQVRDTPFLMVSSDEMAPGVANLGVTAMAPIMAGLEAALWPRAALQLKLYGAPGASSTGRVQPIGISSLLRTLGACQASGCLQLLKGDQANAEVNFSGGEICGATVNAPQSSVGPMAMLHLLAYEWHTYNFVPSKVSESQVPLGELEDLVSTSCNHNNNLISRAFKNGVAIDEVSVDRHSLDQFLNVLPADSIGLLIRLIEGEVALELGQAGVAAPGLLKSMLFDLRRKAVLRPESLRPVRAAERPVQPALPLQPPPGQPVTEKQRRRRWPVVLVAGVTTAVLAAGGYFIFVHFLSP